MRLAALLLASLALGPALSAADEHHDHHHHDFAPLGTATVGSTTLVVGAEGTPVAGKDWAVQVTLAANAPRPKAVRLWVGTADAQGSVKSRAKRHHGAYEAHLEVPKPLPKDSALWISLEATDGTVTTTSVALKAP